MAPDPNIVQRIKPFIQKLEGSIEQARRQRLQREDESRPASGAHRPNSTEIGQSNVGRNGDEESPTNAVTDQPIGASPRRAIPRGMQARPLIRRSSV